MGDIACDTGKDSDTSNKRFHRHRFSICVRFQRFDFPHLQQICTPALEDLAAFHPDPDSDTKFDRDWLKN